MTYKLEKTLPVDRRKILQDEPQLSNRFRNFVDGEAGLTWAVDRENLIYLFRSPSFVREIDNEYHFFYKEKMYVIELSHSVDVNKPVTVTSYTRVPLDVNADIRNQLTEAFAVYGLLGLGSKGSSGNDGSLYSVTPVFDGGL